MQKSSNVLRIFLLVISFIVLIFAVGGGHDAAQAASIPSSDQTSFAAPDDSKVDIALAYIRENRASFSLTEADLADVVVTDEYTSDHTGVTHLYLRQRFKGVDVYNAMMNINIGANDQVLSVGNRFVSNLAKAVVGNPVRLSAEDAVVQGATQVGIVIDSPLIELFSVDSPAQTVVFSGAGIALEDIRVGLIYQPLETGEVRLAWDLAIYEIDAQNWWSIRVDATNGRVLDRNNLVVHDDWGIQEGISQVAVNPSNLNAASFIGSLEDITGILAPASPDSYFVFPPPLESPNHANPPLPPLTEDNRILVVNPASLASPFGWHDTNGAAGAEFTISRGNNVHAYQDSTNINASSGDEPDGGATLVFSYTLDLTQAPSTYRPAAVTNLFYWNNITHDIFYEYGFNEVSGNFQENNYGNGGAGSDSVNAEAQDGGGNCNANFATPADGGNPRMQMYTCNLATPSRDGDLDNGVIVHEYGHGISNRLTGGPATTSCLNNAEQMGEGWSDYLALWATIEPGDAGADPRGMGTYLFGQGTNGAGIRPAPYSTNMGINNYTYDGIKTLSVPHGVGFVWSTMLWEMTWGLIDQHGFDPDLYNGAGGNNLAMQLVMDGMKLQPCSPGFVDGRDAILLADQNLTGGQNQCTIWQAFAKRGLGFSANQGSSGSRADGTEAFDLPQGCLDVLKISKTADPSPAYVGDVMTYTLVATNDTIGTLTGVVITDVVPTDTTYIPSSASHGGSESGGVVSYPPVTMNSGDAFTRTFQVQVDSGLGTVQHFSDDFESGFGNWSMSGLWNSENETDLCGATKTPFPSSSNVAYYGDDTACNYDTGLQTSGALTMVSPVDLTDVAAAKLSFWSYESTEKFSGYDQRIVEISTDGGGNWTQLKALTTEDSWYEESLDLASYVGDNILIRFRFDSVDNQFNGFFGWMVDNVKIIEEPAVLNTACVTADQGDNACDSITTEVVPSPFGVVIDPAGAAKSGDPSQTIAYSLHITNTGTVSDTFNLTVSGNTWSRSTPSAVGPLAAGASADVVVEITIDPAASGGDIDVATVKATSQGSGTKSDSSTLTTTANIHRGVSLDPPTAVLSGDPGQTVAHTLQVTNTGNTTDTFTLAISGNAWSTSAPSTVGPLAVGASTDVTVEVTIDPAAGDGDSDMVTVQAASVGDGAVSDSSHLTTMATANNSPKFTSTPVEAATVGTPFSYSVVTTDLDGGDKLTITPSLLPGWLTLTDHGDGTATLSGTPDAGDVGAHTVVLRVEDMVGAVDTQTFTVIVSDSGFSLYLPVTVRG